HTTIYTLSLHDALPILQGRHHRGPFGFRRAEGAAKGVSREERAAMRLLHAGNADGGPGSGSSEEEVFQRRDQKPYFRQLLPLHRSEEHTSELQSRENLV